MADEFRSDEHMTPFLTFDGWKRFCQHPAITVIELTRTCRCQVCGAVVDPFDYLAMCAKKQDRFRINQQALSEEINRLTDERDQLRKQISTARSERKRLIADNLMRIGGGDHAE